jgi:hypothetical protein
MLEVHRLSADHADAHLLLSSKDKLRTIRDVTVQGKLVVDPASLPKPGIPYLAFNSSEMVCA